MKQNNSTELLSYSFNNIYDENEPPHPRDPKSAIIPRFSVWLVVVKIEKHMVVEFEHWKTRLMKSIEM